MSSRESRWPASQRFFNCRCQNLVTLNGGSQLRLLRSTYLALLSLATAATAAAQEPAPAGGALPASSLAVFLDCQNVGCDFDYIRTEITAVNWVRDREVADVHVLVTGQETGAGGRDFTLAFMGLRTFAGLSDTLHFVVTPNSTDDERRSGLARVLRIGLVRFLARTPDAARLTISFGAAAAGAAQTSTKADPWKAWVFRMGADGFTAGEETAKDFNVGGRFSGNRITAQWKTQVSARENYSESHFEIDDTTTAINIRRNYGFNWLQVRAISPHWSVGVRSDASSSTYENTLRSIRMSPAIEYNVYPYTQSTRRLLKVEYALGFADYRYRDTTIYDKVAETLPLHRMQISTTQNQPWGQVDVGISGIQYLHDRSKYRVSSNGGIEVRVFKGFRVDVGGGYDVIYDQLSLAKKNYTPQEILLRQFQRGTTYSYFVHAGVSYTFGSILNNVVNPRFD